MNTTTLKKENYQLASYRQFSQPFHHLLFLYENGSLTLTYAEGKIHEILYLFHDGENLLLFPHDEFRIFYPTYKIMKLENLALNKTYKVHLERKEPCLLPFYTAFSSDFYTLCEKAKIEFYLFDKGYLRIRLFNTKAKEINFLATQKKELIKERFYLSSTNMLFYSSKLITNLLKEKGNLLNVGEEIIYSLTYPIMNESERKLLVIL